MIEKIVGTLALTVASVSANAQSNPAQDLVDAFKAYQASNENQFAGVGGTCVNGMLFTVRGPVTNMINRVCFETFFPRSFIDNFAAQNRLVFIYRPRTMDLVLIPNGTLATAPKGNVYYLVHYNDAGFASEVTVINDALP